MPILIRNRVGKGYPVYTSTTITEKLSDEGSLNFDILENENTYDLISAVSKMWTVHYIDGANDKRVFVITIVDRQSRGEKQYVSITARQKEIDDLMIKRIYDNVTGSFTVNDYFKIVFEGSGYKYKIPTHVPSSRWENAGDGDSRYDMFKEGLERYGLEYTYDPETKTFTLEPFVEKNTSYYISSKVNANNLKLEEDASECFTYIRGYGGFEEDESFLQGSIQVEFTHPLAKIIGKREAPPKIDGRITKVETMKREVEAIIAQSLKISLSLDFVSLREEFPDAIPKIGHLVSVRDDIIDINDSVRIIEIRTIRDAHNAIVKQDVVLGDIRRRDRYTKSVNNAATLANGLGGGNQGVRTINNVTKRIGATAKAVTEVTNSASSLKYDGLGIHGKSGSSVVSLTEDGIKSSNDAGATYTTLITGNGFNMEAMPTATTIAKGLMSTEDKTKLDQVNDEKFITSDERNKLKNLESNTKGLVITGENGKKYNLTVDSSGQLKAKEV
ncbi:tail tube TT1 domain-containing protein [Staphylococcus felis]|uniref:tail tube TT1 domain-containing protein n=1 Tax=Staphylococcus felis TaxID=46127 RepID=UPI003F41BAD1